MDSLDSRFALVRFTVAYLGQSGQANWWPTTFLDDTGLAFTTYNFARAPLVAATTATVAAAKRLHDDRIGRTHTVHLFRLPLECENAIHRAASRNRGDLLRTVPRRRESLMEFLDQTATEVIEAPAGPIQVGELGSAFTEPGLRGIAKHYAAAFRQGVVCLPYFGTGKA